MISMSLIDQLESHTQAAFAATFLMCLESPQGF